MTHWVRAPHRMLCGGRCSGFIEAKAPMLVIELADVQRVRVRCATCAGIPVDYQQIAQPPPVRSRAATFFRFTEVVAAFDARAVAARNDA